MKLRVTNKEIAPPLRKPWKNAIAVGRAYELLRQDVLDHLQNAQRRIGYRFCRFHGVFHDEMGVVARKQDGTLAFRWHQVDKVYDALLEMGLRPFVELNPMPVALASGGETIFDWRMNVTPPRDYAEWELLVESFCRHLVARYGLEEVRQWYFEVWNEPNLSGFWTGTQAEYWQLYAASARAIKSVSPELRVGGPASSKANWIEDIIQYCSENALALDFVSTHLYPQDEYVTYPDRLGSPHRPGYFFRDTVREVQQIVQNSVRPDLEIHWTEWNTLSTPSTAEVSWVTNSSVDSLFGAATVMSNCVALDGACDTLCWWTASDIFEECGMPHAEFSCTYGLQTVTGLPKATFRAFELLNRLRGSRLESLASEELAPGCEWLAVREADVVQVALWHQCIPEVSQSDWTGLLFLSDLPDTAYSMIQTRLAAGCGSAWETWQAMGAPQDLSPSERQMLLAHSEPEHQLITFEHAKSPLAWEFQIKPGEVYFLEIRPRALPALPKTPQRKELAEWERKMSEASKASVLA